MGHFKKNCPRLVQPSGSQQGSIAPRSQGGDKTQSFSRYVVWSIESSRPQAKARVFAMTQHETLVSPEVATSMLSILLEMYIFFWS